MSIISNVTEITGVGSNGTALETVMSNNENVFGMPFHVALNNATGCSNLGGEYGWYYNNTPYTFTQMFCYWNPIGGWAGFANVVGQVTDDPDNTITCPATTKSLVYYSDVESFRYGDWYPVTVAPGQKIWIGYVVRTSEGNPIGATWNHGYLFVKKTSVVLP